VPVKRKNTGPRRHLVVMAKAARIGQVKTRLGREIGPVQATAFYRHNVAAVVGRLARDPRWTTSLAVSPDRAVSGRMWLARLQHLRRHAQGGGDLGTRMQRLLLNRFPGPVARGPVILVGTDIPAIRPEHIAEAFRQVGRHGFVFGPSADGGFWLVGQSRVPRVRRAFAGVRWSTETTLAQCLGNLAKAGESVGFAAELNDVDNGSDLAEISSWFGRQILPSDVRGLRPPTPPGP
jgi:uncharacterized protein